MKLYFKYYRVCQVIQTKLSEMIIFESLLTTLKESNIFEAAGTAAKIVTSLKPNQTVIQVKHDQITFTDCKFYSMANVTCNQGIAVLPKSPYRIVPYFSSSVRRTNRTVPYQKATNFYIIQSHIFSYKIEKIDSQ